MVNSKFNTTHGMIDKIRSSKGETKQKFCKNIGEYYNGMKKYRQNDTFNFENDPYAKNAQGIGKIMHELNCF